MEKTLRRVLALILALTMVGSPLSVCANASELDGQEQSALDVLPEEPAEVPEETEEVPEETEEIPEETEEAALPAETEAEETADEETEESAEELSDEEYQTNGVTVAASGKCGDSLTWKQDTNGVLTISGTGEMKSYDSEFSPAPWSPNIRTVIVNTGATSIGSDAFLGYSKITKVTLPNTVKVIEDRAFSGCESLTDITLGSGIVTIGEFAFNECTALKELKLPEGLETIGFCAFRYDNITALTIPSTVTEIIGGAFLECHTQITVAGGSSYHTNTGSLLCSDGTLVAYFDLDNTGAYTIPSGTEWIGYGAFATAAISEVVIPNSVWMICPEAFRGCTNLKRVTIGSDVDTIQENAFEGCSALKTIVFTGNAPYTTGSPFTHDVTANAYYPAGDDSWTAEVMEDFGGNITWICGLDKVPTDSDPDPDPNPNPDPDPDPVLPDVPMTWSLDDGTLTISGRGPMPDYSWGNVAPWATSVWTRNAIKRIVVSEGITTVGEYSFNDLMSLESVSLPSTLTSIGKQAFENDYVLSEVTIPKKVSEIGERAFFNTHSLERFSVAADSAYLCAVDGILYTKDCKELIACPAAKRGAVTLPANLKTIRSYACSYSMLDTVVLPEGLKRIEYYAFDQAGVLKNITLPESLDYIGYYAFKDCTSLTEMTIPAGVTQLESTFSGCCNLRTVTFKGFTALGGAFFKDVFATVYYDGSDTRWSEYANRDYGGIITWVSTTKVPAITGDVPDSNITWKVEGTVLTISGSGEIPDFGFFQEDFAPWYAHRNVITSAVIEDGITAVGTNLFYGCTRLQSIVLPETLVSIGYLAFNYCGSVDKITIPAAVTEIGERAFYGSSFREVVFRGSAPTIAEDAFYNKSLTAYYDSTDSSWTSDVRQNYSGTITWKDISEEYQVHSGTFDDSGSWELKDGTLTINYSGRMPGSNYYPWHDYCDEIRQAILTDGVTCIGRNVFLGCHYLESVSIPLSVREISHNVFDGCSSLHKITLPENLRYLYGTFYRSSLNTIIFKGDPPVEIQEGTFQGVTATVKYPANNSKWTEDVMQNYGGNLTWEPSRVCGDNLEWKLEGTKLTISGTGAMDDYNSWSKLAPWGQDITSVVIEEGITYIGAYAFFFCQDLTSVELPQSLRIIGENAFYNSTIRAITLPEGLVEIRARAFYGCGIKKLTIPGSVTEIGKGALGNAAETIILSEDNHCFQIVDNMLLSADGSVLYTCTERYAGGEAVIPESVEYIHSYAFAYANITKATIPDSVEYIDDYVFWCCSSLKIVIFGSSVAHIGWDTLCYCDKLCYVVFRGSAPDCKELFGWSECTATVYYPADDASWTEAVRDRIADSAEVTWVPYNTDEMPDLTLPEEPPEPCGANLEWTLKDGVLTISGTGGMYWYSRPEELPWFDSRMDIRQIIIGSGVTYIYQYAFAYLPNLETVIFNGCPWYVDPFAFQGSNAAALYNAADPDWAYIDRESIIGIRQWVTLDADNILEQKYLNVTIGSRAALHPNLGAQFLGVSFRAEAAEGGEAPFTVDEFGVITGTAVGTGYVYASVVLGEVVFTSRCRIDVSEPSKVTDAELLDSKATVEIFRTEYTAVRVLLKLEQNAAASDAGSIPAGNSSAITSAVFADAETAKYFSLYPIDDRTLEIVPTWQAIEDGQKDARLIKGSYKSAITVTVDDEEFTTSGLLTLTVKKSKPAIKADTVKINSFTRNDGYVRLTGGKVLDVRCVSAPAGFVFDSQRPSVRYTGSAAKASAKLLLSVDVENWAIPAEVTLSVSVSSKVPTVKFQSSSITVPAGTPDSAYVYYACSDPIMKLSDVECVMTDSKGNVIPADNYDGEIRYYLGSNYIRVYTTDDTPAKAVYKITLNYANGGKKAVLTVKTAEASLKLKASGSIDTAVPNSPVKITANIANYRGYYATRYMVNVIESAKGQEDKDVTDLFRVSDNGYGSNGIITITAADPAALKKGCTYTAKIQADSAYTGKVNCESSVKLNIKWSDPKKVTPSVSIKAAGSIDVLRPSTCVRLTPAFKNWFTHSLRPSDLQFYTVSGKTVTPIPAMEAPFTVQCSGDSYIIRANGAVSTQKYSVAFADAATGISTKPVPLSVTMGKVKLGQSTKALTLLKEDRFDSQEVTLTLPDNSLSGFARAELDSKSDQFFSLTDLGNGKYAIGFKDNQVQPGTKTMTVKLNVFMTGNTTAKANAAISVKVTIK